LPADGEAVKMLAATALVLLALATVPTALAGGVNGAQGRHARIVQIAERSLQNWLGSPS
jgi:hypothetical protein